MSVLIESLVLESGRTAEDVLAPFPGYGLVAVTITGINARNDLPDLEIQIWPEDTEPAHGKVVGRKTQAVRKQLARDSRWIVAPPDRPDLAFQ